MTSVRFLKIHPILALVLAVALIGNSGASAGPVSTPQKAVPTKPASAIEDETRVVINIPSRTLWVYNGEEIVRFFPVGVGRPGFPTPVGKFSIIRKVLDPGWENPYLSAGKMRLAPGVTNPLGTRWMGFLQDPGGEYGMHGTDNPGSVGKFSSHGCVRLKVPDAEALFEMIDVGTPVEVIYQPVIIRRNGDEVRVAVYADRFKRGMPTVEKVKADIIKQFPKASVNETKLSEALRLPQEKYILVGLITSDAIGSEPERAQSSPARPTEARSPAALRPIENLTNDSQF